MVSGFESFREHFKGYEDCYTIIGGTACDILMSEAALPFRATKDVDMILLIENRFEEYGALFWDYIHAGGYTCGWRNSELPHFYRFTQPEKENFPVMIELFSRRPDFQLNHHEIHLTPLPVSDEISSLSAIMLDDDYYALMLSGRRVVEGVSVLDAEHLILFKAKAWLELTQKKADGVHVNSDDVKKHKNDVFRLFALVEPEKRIRLPEAVAADMRAFLEAMSQQTIDLRNFGIQGITQEEILESLRTVYLLREP